MPCAERSLGVPSPAMWAEAQRLRAPVGDFPPRWASAWGDDVFGLWAELRVKGVSQKFRWIEPDEFLMGSTVTDLSNIQDKQLRSLYEDELPQHGVTITAGFWLADTPCTQAWWTAVMGGNNPSHFSAGPQAAQRPVEQVSWDDTETFIAALHAQVPQAQAMLPNEAQWEYACRAGIRTAYCWGDKPDTAKANMAGAVKSTSAVKSYAPNAWGLYDMHGNVWEWCADAPRPYRDRPEVNPTGGTEGDARVLRGGSWFNLADWARSAYRDGFHRGYRGRHLGFRLALRSHSPAGGA
jgi:formylglycine-generating enzyme